MNSSSPKKASVSASTIGTANHMASGFSEWVQRHHRYQPPIITVRVARNCHRLSRQGE